MDKITRLVSFLILTIINVSNINGQHRIEDFNLQPVKYKITNEKGQDGYLFDLDMDTILIIKNMKTLKKSLLDRCTGCQRVSLDKLDQLTIKGKKIHVGKIFGVTSGLTLTFIGLANGVPEDGLNGEQLALIIGVYYGLPAVGVGALLDTGINNLRPKSKDKVVIKNGVRSFDDLTEIKNRSALSQFDRLKKRKKVFLLEILMEIQNYPMSNIGRFSFYLDDQSIVSGYMVSGDENQLLLCTDRDKLIDYRITAPPDLKAVEINSILYYQIDK